MLACFHGDTNQVVSSQSLNNKERQIDAWLVVLREENMIFDLFFLSMVEWIWNSVSNTVMLFRVEMNLH